MPVFIYSCFCTCPSFRLFIQILEKVVFNPMTYFLYDRLQFTFNFLVKKQLLLLQLKSKFASREYDDIDSAEDENSIREAGGNHINESALEANEGGAKRSVWAQNTTPSTAPARRGPAAAAADAQQVQIIKLELRDVSMRLNAVGVNWLRRLLKECMRAALIFLQL